MPAPSAPPAVPRATGMERRGGGRRGRANASINATANTHNSSNGNGNPNGSALLKNGRLIKGKAFSSYCSSRGLCHVCGRMQTHAVIGRGLFLAPRRKPLTIKDKATDDFVVYNGYCIQPTCYTLEQAKMLSYKMLDQQITSSSIVSSCEQPNDNSDIANTTTTTTINKRKHNRRRSSMPFMNSNNQNQHANSHTKKEKAKTRRASMTHSTSTKTIPTSEGSSDNVNEEDANAAKAAVKSATSRHSPSHTKAFHISPRRSLQRLTRGFRGRSRKKRGASIPAVVEHDDEEDEDEEEEMEAGLQLGLQLQLEVEPLSPTTPPQEPQNQDADCNLPDQNGQAMDATQNTLPTLMTCTMRRSSSASIVNCNGRRKSMTAPDILAVIQGCSSSKKTLLLNDCDLKDSGTKTLIKKIREQPPPSVKVLCLRSNEIGPDGARSIAQMLQCNDDHSFASHQLHTLRLSHNQIADMGTKHIFEALQFATQSSLTTISLSRNDITDAGAKAIGEALMENSVLKSISLDNNRLGDNGLRHVLQGISQNPTSRLCSLSLANNNISDYGAYAIADFVESAFLKLRQCDTNEHTVNNVQLIISNNNIGNSGAEAILNALQLAGNKKHQVAHILGLQQNHVADGEILDEIAALQETMASCHNRSLTSLPSLRSLDVNTAALSVSSNHSQGWERLDSFSSSHPTTSQGRELSSERSPSISCRDSQRASDCSLHSNTVISNAQPMTPCRPPRSRRRSSISVVPMHNATEYNAAAPRHRSVTPNRRRSSSSRRVEMTEWDEQHEEIQDSCERHSRSVPLLAMSPLQARPSPQIPRRPMPRDSIMSQISLMSEAESIQDLPLNWNEDYDIDYDDHVDYDEDHINGHIGSTSEGDNNEEEEELRDHSAHQRVSRSNNFFVRQQQQQRRQQQQQQPNFRRHISFSSRASASTMLRSTAYLQTEQQAGPSCHSIRENMSIYMSNESTRSIESAISMSLHSRGSIDSIIEEEEDLAASNPELRTELSEAFPDIDDMDGFIVAQQEALMGMSH